MQRPELTEADELAAEANVEDSMEEPTTAEQCGTWGDQEVGAIIRRAIAGEDATDIACDYGETPQLIGALLRHVREGLKGKHAQEIPGRTRGRLSTEAPQQKRRGELTMEQREAVVTRHRNGERTVRIATDMGITESSVRYIVERYGH